ncbi:uncharacterized protein METZ01_LOCUS334264, partial [marine metagenome]
MKGVFLEYLPSRIVAWNSADRPAPPGGGPAKKN